MPARLVAFCFDVHDPLRVAGFWAGVLHRQLGDDPDDGIVLLPDDDTGFRIRFLATDEPKTGQNHLHFDLTSTSPDDQRRTVARALELGGRPVDVGQRPDETHVVLGDPEGNEFCVIAAGNKFLAGCGFLGAVAGDGSQAVGYFWSQALGWPLVWDQDEETAIRSPHGGPKITWGGPPLMPRTGPDRVRFELALPAGGDLGAEVDRLVALGARRVDTAGGDVDAVVLADPDGREFRVLTPR